MSEPITSATEAARLRAAIARDQTSHWRQLFWEPARTKKELGRRESLWFWWGSNGWMAEREHHRLKKENNLTNER